MTQDKFDKDYKGKTILGFKFDASHPIGYTEGMDHYVGKIGTISGWRQEEAVFKVLFENTFHYFYPIKECLEQIKQSNKSEQEIYSDIYELLKKI